MKSKAEENWFIHNGRHLIRMFRLFKPSSISRIIEYIKKNKFTDIKEEIYLIMYEESDSLTVRYPDWFERHKVTKEQLEEQRKEKFSYNPKVSILVPTYNTPVKFLREMIDSVKNQSYANWELCIADGSDTNNEARKVLEEYVNNDSRIVVRYLDDNYGISGNTNKALELATGELIGLLDHDDFVEPDLLYEVVKEFQDEDVDVVYTDEDKVLAPKWKHVDPNFKPDFSIDLLRSHNYITHFFTVKKTIIDKVGNFRSECDGSQDYDLIFRCTEQAKSIKHIPKILYHWRMTEGSTAANPQSKMYCYEAGKKAIEDHLKRVGVEANVEIMDLWGMYHTTYKIQGNPKISIIIPNMDHIDDLDRCIRSIENKSTYRNFEFIIVENNSVQKETFEYYKTIEKEFDNIKVIKWNKEFNYSAINNYGVKNCDGEVLLLLNNDTELITPTALEEMLGIALRKDVGCVGAKLLYADNTVQHAGVVVGFGGYAGHVFNGFGDDNLGYMARLQINCNYSAVTAACLMTRRSVYEAVGGLDEQFVVACNDVDYCLKTRKLGLNVVYNAFSKWYHYESKSRGSDEEGNKKIRFENEKGKFRGKWMDILENGDPLYNINFPFTEGAFKVERE